MTGTRVLGHELEDEGAAYVDHLCEMGGCSNAVVPTHELTRNADGTGFRADGHAACVCGWYSAHLPTRAKRRAAHRDHKRAVVAAGSGGEEGP